MSRPTGTPVYIWCDLPPDLQLADNPERTNWLSPPPPLLRCLARSRGDTADAHIWPVPQEGGWRCARRRVIDGLCRRHYDAAPPSIRRRAAELVRQETE